MSALLGRAHGLVLLALAVGGAGIQYAIDRGSVNDDTYAFLDWGRDLRHGFVPLLEHRTFHPLPVALSALLSFSGPAAATLIIWISLGCLALTAVAGWRIVRALRLPQPAPALAAALVVTNPLLSVLSYSAYVNIPFAVLIAWALVVELERGPSGRRWVWALLVLAGLVRPEGWAFAAAYAGLDWWRGGRPRELRAWAPAVGLIALAPAIWLGVEWLLFGDPFYSARYTRAQPGMAASVGGMWGALTFAFTIPLLVIAGAGIVTLTRLAPRREAWTTLGAGLVAALTMLGLNLANYNVPSRHFSALVAIMCPLVAAGAAAPGRLLARRGGSRLRAASLGALGGVALVALAAGPTLSWIRRNFASIDTTRYVGSTLVSEMTSIRRDIDVAGARPHSIAMVGAEDFSQLSWTLAVPADAVSDAVEASTVVMIQPSGATWQVLRSHRLTDYDRVAVPRGWVKIAASPSWEIYTAPGRLPVKLG